MRFALPFVAALVLSSVAVAQSYPFPPCASSADCPPGSVCAYLFETPDCPPLYALVQPIDFIQYAQNKQVVFAQLCTIDPCDDTEDEECFFSFAGASECVGGAIQLFPRDFYRPVYGPPDPVTGRRPFVRVCADLNLDRCYLITPQPIAEFDPCCNDLPPGPDLGWFCCLCATPCEDQTAADWDRNPLTVVALGALASL